jgi:hypothetical protein
MIQRIKHRVVEWEGVGSQRSKEIKRQSSTDKSLPQYFWDAKGAIVLNILLKESTMTSVDYANLVGQLRTAISTTPLSCKNVAEQNGSQ